jgi:hypothetical protein
MIQVWNLVKSFITDPAKRNFVLGMALVVVLMLWLKSCNDKKNLENQVKVQKEISDQNQRAQVQPMHEEKTKDGQAEADKASYIAKLDDLAKLNRDLYAQSQLEIGKLKAIIVGGFSVNNPLHVSEQLENYGNNSYGLLFEKSSNNSDSLMFSLKGVSKFSIHNNVVLPGITDITENKTTVKLVLGFKENKENYEVFARSPSKLLKVDSLSGSLIIPKHGGDIIPTAAPKPKRFGIGPYIGYGLTPDFKLQPSIGISLQYNIIRF